MTYTYRSAAARDADVQRAIAQNDEDARRSAATQKRVAGGLVMAMHHRFWTANQPCALCGMPHQAHTGQ